MKERALGNLSLRRGKMRGIAMNAALLALLAGIFLWSAAGNAVELVRDAARSLITPTQSR
jgi:hypothetical protein